MKYKIDFHTHSINSPDGGLTISDYTKIFQNNILDVLAITDHNGIEFALNLKKKFGKKIIVGQEIKSSEGEIIGLFLSKTISPGLLAKETIKEIQNQNGLVYIPHPFEKLRKGISKDTLKNNIEDIDIFEIYNGRALEKPKELNYLLENKNNFCLASSSDAHCIYGVGKTYALVEAFPTRKNILSLLKKASLTKNPAPLIAYICPMINRLRKKIKL